MKKKTARSKKVSDSAVKKGQDAGDAAANSSVDASEQAAAKSAVDSAVQAADSKTNSQSAAKPDSHADSKTDSHADSQSDSKTDSKTDAQPDSQTNATESATSEAEVQDPLAEMSAEELRDMLRRVAAERDNVARRALSEIQKARKAALNSFAKSICEVCDCLQAALDGEGDMREGVELTLRKMTTAMENNGIRPVRPDIGAAFDPSLHEAIGVNGEAGKDENTVAAVVQNGYTLDGQVVRAAQIIVYKSAN